MYMHFNSQDDNEIDDINVCLHIHLIHNTCSLLSAHSSPILSYSSATRKRASKHFVKIKTRSASASAQTDRRLFI